MAAHRAALLTPVAKAFSTDVGCDVASLGVQVHGGMGFIEESGAAQHFRDARILPIYEGTNGIQAIDLVQRKLPLESGGIVGGYLDELAQGIAAVSEGGMAEVGAALDEALECLRSGTMWLLDNIEDDRAAALAGATPYLRAFALTAGGVYLARAALRDGAQGNVGDAGQLATFFANNLLGEVPGLIQAVMEGGASVLADSDWLNGAGAA